MGLKRRTLVLFLLIGAAWVGGILSLSAASQGAVGADAPPWDGRFSLRTSTIDPERGINWEKAQLSFNDQDYPFVLQAQSIAAPDVMMSLTGEHINIDGLVYNLKKLSDFAGLYTRTTPEAAKAVGGSGSEAAFQNAQGVVVQIARGSRSELLYLSLLGDSFLVLMSGY